MSNAMADRFTMIASAYLFLVTDEKILLSRRFHTGYEDGKYSVPAGHLEKGETLTQCLARESKEEIGITIKTTDVSLVYMMHRKETDIRVDFFFTAKTWKGVIKNCEPKKCDDVQWFPLIALPSTTVGYIKSAIEAWQKGEVYGERGFI